MAAAGVLERGDRVGTTAACLRAALRRTHSVAAGWPPDGGLGFGSGRLRSTENNQLRTGADKGNPTV